MENTQTAVSRDELALILVLQNATQGFKYLAHCSNGVWLHLELRKLAKQCSSGLVDICAERDLPMSTPEPPALSMKLRLSTQILFNQLTMQHDEAVLAVSQLFARDSLHTYRRILKAAGAEINCELWTAQFRMIIENFHRVTELRYRFA